MSRDLIKRPGGTFLHHPVAVLREKKTSMSTHELVVACYGVAATAKLRGSAGRTTSVVLELRRSNLAGCFTGPNGATYWFLKDKAS